MDEDTTNNSKALPFQEDVNVDDDSIDPIMVEQNDDPVETLGVPAEELKDELDQYADMDSPGASSDGDGGFNHGTSDDRREMVEDMDEGDGAAVPGI